MPYQAVILTVSGSCAAGTRTDTSGPAIRAMLENAGFAVQAMQTVPDEEGQIWPSSMPATYCRPIWSSRPGAPVSLRAT